MRGIVDTNDTDTPIVVSTLEPHLDSHGSSAERDSLRRRAGREAHVATNASVAHSSARMAQVTSDRC